MIIYNIVKKTSLWLPWTNDKLTTIIFGFDTSAVNLFLWLLFYLKYVRTFTYRSIVYTILIHLQYSIEHYHFFCGKVVTGARSHPTSFRRRFVARLRMATRQGPLHDLIPYGNNDTWYRHLRQTITVKHYWLIEPLFRLNLYWRKGPKSSAIRQPLFPICSSDEITLHNKAVSISLYNIKCKHDSFSDLAHGFKKSRVLI